MITFVPFWENTSTLSESLDDLIGYIKAIELHEQQYQIYIKDYIPNLRYFLHRFDLLESNYFSIFDELQGFEGQEQAPIDLQNLNFPEAVSFVYSVFNILVLQDNMVIGKVTLREAGSISEVYHFHNSLLSEVEVYDDRGFISSRQFYSNGQLEYTSYLDSHQREIFVEFEQFGDCNVNPENTHGLKKLHYDSIEEIKFEMLEAKFNKKQVDKILISITNQNLKYISLSSHIEKMVFSFFKGHYIYEEKLNEILLKSSLESRAIILDSVFFLKEFCRIGIPSEKMHKVSPFDSRFNLSTSQELKEEVVYFDSRNITIGSCKSAFKNIINYFYNEKIESNNYREFEFIIRTNPKDEKEISEIIHEIFFLNFPEEMKEIDAADEETLSQSILQIKSLLDSVEVVVLQSEEEFFKIINKVRLIVDLSNEPDLFTQIAGISAGVPQINSVKTEYVEHKKNGLILENEKNIEQSLRYYLGRLKHWQEARTSSIKKIKVYSNINLVNSLCEIFNGGSNE